MKKRVLFVFLLLIAFPIFMFSQAMSGTYSIGVGEDYLNLDSALTYLNTNGASGPVIFEITENYIYTYENFPLFVDTYPGCSATNSLTIKPAGGADIEIIGDSGMALTYFFRIEAPYVRIDGSNSNTESRNLTIYNTSIYGGNDCIDVSGNNFTLVNCIIKGFDSNQLNEAIFVDGNNCFISNCEIYHYSNGINLHSDNFNVGHNYIHDIKRNAINVFSAENGIIIDNEIDNIISEIGGSYGIICEGITGNLYILNNKINNIITHANGSVARGINLYNLSSDFVFIANNIVSNVASGNGSTSIDHPYGIYFNSPSLSTNIKIFHNTVNMPENLDYGLNSEGTGCYSAGIYLDVQNVNFKNNIIQNNLGERTGTSVFSNAYAIYSNKTTNPFIQCDYNIYNTEANVDENFVFYANSTNMNFDQWQTFSSMDNNSYSENPLLDDSCYLEKCSQAITNGLFLNDVSTDITQVYRDSVMPTIGAYEYQIQQAQNVILAAPVKGFCYLTWELGNTCKYAVFMKEGDVLPETPQPVDGTTYLADTNFGDGDQIGSSGWYCVYNGDGTDNEVFVENIDGIYTVMVCGYFGNEGNEVYITETNDTNPVTGFGESYINSINNTLNIFPNPTNDFVFVETEENSSKFFKITDITGKEINPKKSETSGGILFDFSGFDAGIYFIFDLNGNRSKIIKM